MPRRDNGFRRDGALSLNAHQLGGASLYLGLVLGFYLLQEPAIEDATARLACEIAFACVAAVVCGAFFRAAAIDPADDTHALATKPGDVMRCDLCAHAVSRGSKHCRSCDKCVAHFDHHCRWLNNCVGSKNYAPFFLLLCSTLTLTVAQLCAGAYLTHWAVTEKDEADALLRSSRYPTKINRNHFLAALGVYLAAGALLCYVVADLFFFHLLLMKRGITTYDYVLGARAAEEVEGGAGGSAAKPLSCLCLRCGGGGDRKRVAPEDEDDDDDDDLDGTGGRRRRRRKKKRVEISCWKLLFSKNAGGRREIGGRGGGGGGGGGGFGDIETAVVESVSSSDDGSETYRVGQPRVKT